MECRMLSEQKEYAIVHNTTGSKMVMIASEPITKSCVDWIKVPPNTCLVVTKEKDDFVNVIRCPLTNCGTHSLQASAS